MLEELSTQQERESDDDPALEETTHDAKEHDKKKRDRPRGAELQPVTRQRRQRSLGHQRTVVRQQQRDDKRRALSGTY
jgi:hypothetical protein